jgi:hypothetical protein
LLTRTRRSHHCLPANRAAIARGSLVVSLNRLETPEAINPPSRRPRARAVSSARAPPSQECRGSYPGGATSRGAGRGIGGPAGAAVGRAGAVARDSASRNYAFASAVTGQQSLSSRVSQSFEPAVGAEFAENPLNVIPNRHARNGEREDSGSPAPFGSEPSSPRPASGVSKAREPPSGSRRARKVQERRPVLGDASLLAVPDRAAPSIAGFDPQVRVAGQAGRGRANGVEPNRRGSMRLGTDDGSPAREPPARPKKAHKRRYP